MADPTEYLRAKQARLQERGIKHIFGLPQLSCKLIGRDRLAFTKILAQVRHSPVVSYWGALHLVGIGTMLEEAGFTHVDTAWRKAWPLTLD
jgi:hypothetical protein